MDAAVRSGIRSELAVNEQASRLTGFFGLSYNQRAERE